jgi:hypothetical protein
VQVAEDIKSSSSHADAPFNSIDKALFYDEEGREIGDLGL